MEIHNIKPCFWGKKYWGTIFSMTAVYPENPDKEYINGVRMNLLSLKFTLPCAGCRVSYSNFITQSDTNAMNNEFFSSRDNFIGFIHRLRSKVNKKVGLEYNISKDYFKLKLDKMCCVEGNDVDGYINELSEAPFIPESLRTTINNYVHKNKNFISNYNSKYTDFLTSKMLNFIKKPIFDINNKNFKLWYKRNLMCRNIINKIYNNLTCGNYTMNDSFIKDKSLHIQLFYMGCTIIPLEDLLHIFNKK